MANDGQLEKHMFGVAVRVVFISFHSHSVFVQRIFHFPCLAFV
jgi:hypothetical protein